MSARNESNEASLGRAVEGQDRESWVQSSATERGFFLQEARDNLDVSLGEAMGRF